jgi:hypothetical protein
MGSGAFVMMTIKSHYKQSAKKINLNLKLYFVICSDSRAKE